MDFLDEIRHPHRHRGHGLGSSCAPLYGWARVLQSVKWTNLFDKIPERIQALLVIGFGQKKFLIDKREKSAGWMHFFIFWGFTILGVRVATAFAQGWFGPEFHLPLLGVDMLGGPYLLLKDLMEVFVLVSIGYALTRWLVLHPHRLYGFRPAEDRLAGQDHVEAIVTLLHRRIMLTDLSSRPAATSRTATCRTSRRSGCGRRSLRRSRACCRSAPAPPSSSPRSAGGVTISSSSSC
jgi:hypothetical protein